MLLKPTQIGKRIFNGFLKVMGASRFYNETRLARREELTHQLQPLLGQKVLAGPFTGMILPSDHSWRDGDFLPKLIGSYESNLREALSKAVSRGPKTVINVGCAEGYYAVGLARLIPQA